VKNRHTLTYEIFLASDPADRKWMLESLRKRVKTAKNDYENYGELLEILEKAHNEKAN